MKKRLDQLLVEKELFASRSKAQAAISAGQVYVNGQKSDKAGKLFSADARIEIKGNLCPYVSRGGVKLERALDEFRVEVKDKICLDIGASTGGFTDCLLQRGAAKVYAIDVGYGQLAWKLRQEERVVVVEKTNVRHLVPENFYSRYSFPACRLPAGRQGKARPITHYPALAVVDVSFISLAKVLPAVYSLLADKAEIIALIKPQFEAKREQVGKGGIVRSEEIRSEVVEKVKTEAKAVGFKVKGLIQSPITGADGNVEFLLLLTKGDIISL